MNRVYLERLPAVKKIKNSNMSHPGHLESKECNTEAAAAYLPIQLELKILVDNRV